MTKTHYTCDEKQGPLCGSRVGELSWDGTYDSTEVDCKKCKKLLCEDCGGSGFQNGRTSGIYCHCEHATALELKNENLR